MKLAADHIKNFGVTESITCPQCQKPVFMNILKASNGVGAFGISLYDYNHDFLLSVPSVWHFTVLTARLQNVQVKRNQTIIL